MSRRTRAAPTPVLRFTPYAWAKLLFLRDAGDTEVGGFGIAAEENPLLIVDFVLVRQTCTWVTVKFHDEAVADLFDSQVDKGRVPDSFFRVWCHTHPGDCPQPSSVDEATLERVFGSCDWCVMFIIAQCGETYARLRFGVGPGGEMQIPVEVDYSQPFEATNFAVWKAEYDANVLVPPKQPVAPRLQPAQPEALLQDPYAVIDEEELAEWQDQWWEYVDESAPALEVR